MAKNFDHAYTEATAILTSHAGALEAARQVVSGFFARLGEGAAPSSRKPSWMIRLVADPGGSPMVTLSPSWDEIGKVVDASRIHVAVSVTATGEPPKSRLELSLAEAEPPRVYRFSRHAAEDASVAARILADFVASPAEVFARSRTHCAICGRALTDEESIRRGIGPECFEKTQWLAMLV